MTAVTAIANIVKSSLGPVGLDKMLVDDIGVSFLILELLIFKDSFQISCNVKICTNNYWPELGLKWVVVQNS